MLDDAVAAGDPVAREVDALRRGEEQAVEVMPPAPELSSAPTTAGAESARFKLGAGGRGGGNDGFGGGESAGSPASLQASRKTVAASGEGSTTQPRPPRRNWVSYCLTSESDWYTAE